MSGKSQGVGVDLNVVNGAEVEGDAGVKHAGELMAFTEAAMSSTGMSSTGKVLAEARAALRAVLSKAAFVDACAIVCAFNIVDRIADATGIPLDGTMAAMSADVRTELDLARFASSANTPGAG